MVGIGLVILIVFKLKEYLKEDEPEEANNLIAYNEYSLI
jgi:hypothetical protein